jgi:hypothetical protein
MSNNTGPLLRPSRQGQMADPLHPAGRLPRQNRAYPPMHNEPKPDLEKEPDPAQEIADYCLHLWVQHLAPIRTRCWRCKKDSPVVYVPAGAMLFGAQGRRGQVDVTKQAVLAFAQQGWKFQLHRSYCPDCKNLGAI